VKGWPEKSPNTQARHWFSQAAFDLVMYRDQSPSVELAVGLPDGFKTYRNLLARITWLRANLPCDIYFVSEAGLVDVVKPQQRGL
jgi:hypothetical protein